MENLLGNRGNAGSWCTNCKFGEDPIFGNKTGPSTLMSMITRQRVNWRRASEPGLVDQVLARSEELVAEPTGKAECLPLSRSCIF